MDKEENVNKIDMDTNINSDENEIKEEKLQENNEEENMFIEENDNVQMDKKEAEEEYDDIDEKDLSTPTEKKQKRKKTLIIIAASILLFVVLFAIFACFNKMNTNVHKNVYIYGIDLSGKTQEEVLILLKSMSKTDEEKIQKVESLNAQIVKEKISNLNLDLYQENEKIYTVTSEDINFNIDVEKTLKEIMGFGRKSNLIVDNFQIIKSFFTKIEIKPIYKYDYDKLDEICKNIELSVKNRFVNDNYSVDEQNNKLIITRGITGNTINIEMEKENIIGKFSTQLENISSKETDDILHLSIIEKKPDLINVEDVYNKVKRDAKDAYIDESVTPIKLVDEVVGYNLSLEELRNLLEKEENKKEGKVIEFELQVIEPKVKLEDIVYTLYKDKLAGYTTYFDASQWARANNLSIALEYLNGKIVMPGEIFSYNDAIGDTTVAKGYMAAATFKAGTVVQELGGGICQTTSTLYNVALMANLEIIERHQHGLPVGYVPPSRDATVYSPNLDFKFKNTRKYPVKIVTSFSNSGSLNISIYGTKEEEEYEVILSQKYLSTIPFTTRYEYDDSMSEGTEQIIAYGVNGYTSESYITKKLNGVVTYSAILSQDKYNPQQQIVRVGTKKVEQTNEENKNDDTNKNEENL